MSKELISKLSAFIKEPLLEDLELQLMQPNFFYELNLQHAEIRHSNFLAWLLNPKKSHGLGTHVLRHFLKDIFSENYCKWINEFDVDLLDLSEVEIRREWNNIDLLIITDKFAVCIENKIWSTDHSGQLARYRDELKKSLPKHHHAFVYLTPEGVEPSEEEGREYFSYSYYKIAKILQSVIGIYSEALSTRSRIYIEDYLTVIRREIVKDDKINELASRIYLSHPDALDFIFKNKPDRLAEVGKIFESFILRSDWVLGPRYKGSTQFLTRELDKIIPRSGTWWKDREAFLFAFDYNLKKITFRSVISPGLETNRQVLSKALERAKDASRPKGKVWLCHFLKNWSFDVTDSKNDDESIKDKLEKIWPKVETFVKSAENEIIKVSKLFTYE